MKILDIDVRQLKNMLDNKNDFILLDVRTELEIITSSISPNAIHIPMSEIPTRFTELNKNKTYLLDNSIFSSSYEPKFNLFFA